MFIYNSVTVEWIPVFWKLSQSASCDEQIQCKLYFTIQTVFSGSSVIQKQTGVWTAKSYPTHKDFIISRMVCVCVCVCVVLGTQRILMPPGRRITTNDIVMQIK